MESPSAGSVSHVPDPRVSERARPIRYSDQERVRPFVSHDVLSVTGISAAGGLRLSPVRPCDDLEEVTVRVVPVDTSATVMMIDLTGSALGRVRPVLDPLGHDSAIRVVELVLADKKRKVLRRQVPTSPVRVVERRTVAHIDDEELAGEIAGRLESQDLDQMGCAELPVRAPNDQVIQFGHNRRVVAASARRCAEHRHRAEHIREQVIARLREDRSGQQAHGRSSFWSGR